MITAAELHSRMHYDADSGVFTWLVRPAKNIAPGSVVGGPDADGYLQTAIAGRKYKLHRLAWLYVFGRWPAGEIDHIDRNRANNRIANLREATRKQNCENQRHRRAGNFPGVYWYARRSMWRVAFRHEHVGYFSTLLDAVAARVRRERELYTHSPFSADRRVA